MRDASVLDVAGELQHLVSILEAPHAMPERLGDLWEVGEREADLADALLEGFTMAESLATDTERLEDQLAAARETLRHVIDLTRRAGSMTAEDLRTDLAGIVSDSRAEL